MKEKMLSMFYQGIPWLDKDYPKHGIIIEPSDFKPEEEKIYLVRILKDTKPGERKGVYLLKVVGEKKKEEKEKIKSFTVRPEFSPKRWRWITYDIGKQLGKPGKIALFPEGIALDARSRYEVEIVEEGPKHYQLKIIREIKPGSFQLREFLKK